MFKHRPCLRDVYTVVLLKCGCLFFSSDLLYNLTADAEKRHKGLPARVYFGNGAEQTGAVSQLFSLEINRQQCHQYTSFVRVSFPQRYPSTPHVPQVCPIVNMKSNFFCNVHSWSYCALFIHVIPTNEICLCNHSSKINNQLSNSCF